MSNVSEACKIQYINEISADISILKCQQMSANVSTSSGFRREAPCFRREAPNFRREARYDCKEAYYNHKQTP